MQLPRDTRSITPIPSSRADFVVTIDGQPYAGFVNRTYAEMAIALWCGEIDGRGDPVPFHARDSHGWAAIRGRHVEIVTHSHR